MRRSHRTLTSLLAHSWHACLGGRGQSDAGRRSAARTGRRGVRRRRVPRRCRRAVARPGVPVRPRRARHPPAGDERLRGVPHPARGRRAHAGPDVDGQGRRGGRGRGPRPRRRRLPAQALRVCRAARPYPRPAAPCRWPSDRRHGDGRRGCRSTSPSDGVRSATASSTSRRGSSRCSRRSCDVAASRLRRSELFDLVWGAEHPGLSNVVDVYVGYLRRKLDLADTDAGRIETVRGIGYRMVA